jgi:hypothetical protein
MPHSRVLCTAPEPDLRKKPNYFQHKSENQVQPEIALQQKSNGPPQHQTSSSHFFLMKLAASHGET